MNKRIAICLLLLINLSVLWGTTIPEHSLLCNLSVDAGPDQEACNIGDQVQLSGFVSDPFATYSWTPTTGLSNPFNLNPTVTVSGTTTYTLEAQFVDAVNLVVNGDFNMGAVGFSSDYIPGTGGPFGLLSGEGQYAVDNNPANTHNNFSPCSDHTGDAIGNMMVINGAAAANQNVWCQTVSVSPGTNYEFGAWVAMVINSSPAILQFSINGVLIGNLLNANPAPCAWIPFTAQWNSGANGSAEICIVNQNTNPSGNDFALDDITFNEVCTATDEVTVQLNQPAQTFLQETVCPASNCVIIEGIPYCGTGNYEIDLQTSEGCDSTIFLSIVENLASIVMPPYDNLSCITELVPLSPLINAAGLPINFQWSGPNGFFSLNQNIIVTNPGTYSLTVDVLLNGEVCTIQDDFFVAQTDTPPLADAGTNVTLNCGDTFPVLLDASGSTSGPNIYYTWTGPGVSSNDVMVSANQFGTYNLLVQNTVSGCQDLATVQIIEGSNLPPINPTVNGGLDCQIIELQLMGESSTAGVDYSWTGPNGFTSTTANPMVTAGGYYYLTVSLGANCSVMDSVLVQQDTTVISPTVDSALLSCTAEDVTLSVDAPEAGYTYSWTGAGGFAGSGTSVMVTLPGNYTVTGMNAANGCTSMASTVVNIDADFPQASASGAALDCNQLQANISGSSTSSDVDYSWVGPNGFTSSLPNPTVNFAGEYIFSVAATNGCTSVIPVTVTIDTLTPDLAISDLALGCTDLGINLIANTNAGIDFSWSGPNGFTAVELNPEVNIPGTYDLIITAANGCTEESQATLTLDEEEVDLDLTGGDLDCLLNSVELSANSSFAIDQYNWSSSNGFMSTAAMPEVGQAGTYILEVNTVAGCVGIDSIVVEADEDLPNISASGGSIFCDPDEVTLQGGSTTPGTTYSWEGPNGFSTTTVSPTVSVPGDYTFSVNAGNGCVATQEVEVLLENDLPNISAVGGTIFCDPDEVALQGNSTSANVNYLWEGPNGFSSIDNAPITNTPGDYTLSITGANGCVATEEVEVLLENELPNISAVGGTIFCDPNDVMLEGNSTSTNVNYLWEGPNGFSSNNNAPLVDMPGDYTLSVIGANGCVAIEEVTVDEDTEMPDVSAFGQAIDCEGNPGQLFGSSSEPVTFQWWGPNNFSSDLANPMVTNPGFYSLTVTDQNGCQNQTLTNVSEAVNIGFTEISGGTLDCEHPTVILAVTSNHLIYDYEWSGPGIVGFGIDITVAEPGEYSVTIQNVFGCEGIDTILIEQDEELPIYSLSDSVGVDCGQPQILLNLELDDPDNTVAWTGPGGFMANEVNPLATLPGIYTVTISASNGCTTLATTELGTDFTSPEYTISTLPISCTQSIGEITIADLTPGTTIDWTSQSGNPGSGLSFTSTIPDDVHILFTGANGCQVGENVSITGSADLPTVSAEDLLLNCNQDTDLLLFQSDVPLQNISWTGPAGFASNLPNPEVGTAGIYTLTGLTATGCLGSAVANVVTDFATPEVVDISATFIDCQNPNSILQVQSNNPLDEISWTGPNNFSAAGANQNVNTSGVYTATILGSNGCSITESITVMQDNSLPELTLSAPELDCNNPLDNLLADASIPGGDFEWVFQNAVVGNSSILNISEGGSYTLNYNLPGGCSNSASISVEEDFVEPDLSLSNGLINCHSETFELSPISTANITAWSWTGPNGFSSNLQNPNVNQGGEYLLSIIADNGCINSTTANVVADFDSPAFDIDGGQIDCNQLTTQIAALGNGLGFDFAWSGPDNYESQEQSPIVENGGTYDVLITGANGCQQNLQTLVEVDTLLPVFSIDGGVLTCVEMELTLAASGNITGQYQWTGPNGFNSNATSIEVSEAGTYTLLLTPGNGCENMQQAVVEVDQEVPSLNALDAHLSCLVSSATLQAEISEAGAINWTGPNNFSSEEIAPTIAVAGNYLVNFIAEDNGCSAQAQLTVTEDEPLLSEVTLLDPLCAGEEGQVFFNSTEGGVAPYVYSIDGGQTFSAEVPGGTLSVGAYNFVVQDAGDCSWDTSLVVNSPPNIYVQLLTSIEIDFGQETILQPTFNFPESNIQSIEWTPATGLSCTDCLEPIASPEVDTEYRIIVTTENGCVADSEIFLRVQNDKSVYIPNVFSPNQDGSNDAFTVFADPTRIQQIDQMIIYDRWGEEVYRATEFPVNDLSFGWDGRLNGEAMNPAVFVYYVELTYLDGTQGIYKGDVTLVR